jgi:hypothetical protein
VKTLEEEKAQALEPDLARWHEATKLRAHIAAKDLRELFDQVVGQTAKGTQT